MNLLWRYGPDSVCGLLRISLEDNSKEVTIPMKVIDHNIYVQFY